MPDERDVAVVDRRPLFFSALRDLYLKAGKPSARSISRELGDVSHTTVADMLNGRHLPRWAIARRVIGLLGGDEASFQPLWTLAVDEPGGEAAADVVGSSGSVSVSYIGTQVLGVSAVPVSVAARDPRAVFTAVGLEDFVGREWLAGEVDRFVACNPCGYVFIEAEAGLGKTAFAAWLVRTRGYLSHFSRYSGGQSVRVALQNLSAQLIVSCGLDEEVPGGILPDWAQTPGGFEVLLGRAARRVREDGRRELVLVVDGLDEAEPSGDGLPFGLPTLLPDGVYVIGTYRTGQAPVRTESPYAILSIRKDDSRNRDDIRAFLTEAVAGELLAARLADADLDPAEFTDLLAYHCDGVWVYLRYVLQELRLGLRRPDAMSDLPSGLREYYADQIRRWQRDPAWDNGLLSLVATLGVAAEPLPTSTLARLSGGLDPATVRRWCDLTLRPLLTTTRAAAVRQPLRYEFYHTSLREALLGADGESRTLLDNEPYEIAALADELKQATLTAHSRIASTYLSFFGGLDSGLHILAEDPDVAGIHGGYPLRNLTYHLQQADRSSDLNRLMATENVSNDTAVNVWFVAHDWAEDISSYLADVARARDISAAAVDEALNHHQPAAALGMEIRYDLMAASIASRDARISADLVEQAIRTGLWSPDRGLDHARRLTDSLNHIDALMTVYRYMTADEKASVLAEALAVAAAITDDEARARAFAGLAPHLPAAQRAEVLAAALAAAGAIADDYARAQILTGVASHLSPVQRAEALAVAAAITDDEARARAFAGLAPHLPAAQRAEVLAAALAAAGAIADDYARAQILTGVASHLSPVQRAEALAVAAAITDDEARARAFAGLAPHLPGGPAGGGAGRGPSGGWCHC